MTTRSKGAVPPPLVPVALSAMELHGAIDGGRPRRVVQRYGDLVDALRDRREALGLTVMDLDARAGWSDGLTTKLENWHRKWGRGAGPVILPLWLEALGMVMVLAESSAPRERPPDSMDQMELDLRGGRMNAVRMRRRSLALMR